MSIIKDKDINNCDEYALAVIGEFGLHNLAKAFPLHPFFLEAPVTCPLLTRPILTRPLLTRLLVCHSSDGENEDS